MATIRTRLRNGFLRTQLGVWLPAVLGIGIWACLSYSGFSVIAYWPGIPDFFKLTAAIAAILSASSYNLRIKAFDYSLKLVDQGCPQEYAKRNMEETSCCLTNLVLLSFLTSLILFFSTKTVLGTPIIGNLIISLGASLLLSCCIQYIYVLFAFEKLEDKIMTDMCDKKQYEMRKKHLAHMQEMAQKPDTKMPDGW
ncbi:hypothetical protein QET40_06690 [Akkermansia sp. N21169]|uniref:hypothetical protein n=1 Tax=Akkermansia sp. N21169 TaxID=3040765 RepID=UPI00244EC484|nr:hypothetical protein [Akkermansia sp. N21169]MDH3068801.1 hypothetical protein [Akkermansia sp. N21169]